MVWGRATHLARKTIRTERFVRSEQYLKPALCSEYRKYQADCRPVQARGVLY